MPLTCTRRSLPRSASRPPRSPLMARPSSRCVSKLYTAWTASSIGGQFGQSLPRRRGCFGNGLAKVWQELTGIDAKAERLALVMRHMPEAGDDPDQSRLVGAVQQDDAA